MVVIVVVRDNVVRGKSICSTSLAPSIMRMLSSLLFAGFFLSRSFCCCWRVIAL